jgi:hypothetical protein
VEEAQAAAGCVGRRHRPRGAVVEEAGASHPSSVGSGSGAGGSDASAGNRADTSGARIRADGAEQLRCPDVRGASAAQSNFVMSS